MLNIPTIYPNDELMSAVEVAAALGVSRPTIHAWALRGDLPARWIAGRLVFRFKDVAKFKKQRAATTVIAAEEFPGRTSSDIHRIVCHPTVREAIRQTIADIERSRELRRPIPPVR